MMQPEQEAKLPKYARMELMRLRSRAEHLDREIAALTSAVKTRIYYGHDLVEGRRYIRDDRDIAFVLGDCDGNDLSEEVRCAIERDERGQYLRVMGGDSFIVEPQASNVVFVRIPGLRKQERRG